MEGRGAGEAPRRRAWSEPSLLRRTSCTRGCQAASMRAAAGSSKPDRPEVAIRDFKNGTKSVMRSCYGVELTVGGWVAARVEVRVGDWLGVRLGVHEAVTVGGGVNVAGGL